MTSDTHRLRPKRSVLKEDPQVTDREKGIPVFLLSVTDYSERAHLREGLHPHQPRCTNHMVHPASQGQLGNHVPSVQIPTSSPQSREGDKHEEINTILPQKLPDFVLLSIQTYRHHAKWELYAHESRARAEANHGGNDVRLQRVVRSNEFIIYVKDRSPYNHS